MGQFVSRSRSPKSAPGPQDGDLEASSAPNGSVLSRNQLDGDETMEQELAAFKSTLGRLTVQDYDGLPDDQRDKLKNYEYLKLQQEHTKLTGKASTLSPEKRKKLLLHDDSIQPHTDEGGDAYYIGDAYGPVNPVFAKEWSLDEPGPYLRYVKKLAQEWTHLEYLAHWMEVSCAPPKWKQLRRNTAVRETRANHTKVCFVDYTDAEAVPSPVFSSCANLREALVTETVSSKARKARLIIVEDLSRNVIETLGTLYDVDPLFFLSHIMDYLFHNTRDRWVELPNLDVDARQMSHFTLSYLRARYFEDEEAFERAEEENGRFNVLRRLDSDRSRKRFMKDRLDLPGASVALSRAKTSLWVKPKKDKKDADEPITAILLVDPTVTADRSHPLWGGYRPFGASPSMEMVNAGQTDAPTRKSLFDDIVYWSSRMKEDDILQVQREPRYIAMAMYKLVVADWMTVLKYMTTMLGKIEWEFEKPHWGEAPGDVDALLLKLSPWRRNVGYYETMISEAIARLFPPEVRAPLHASPGNEGYNMSMFIHPHSDLNRGIFSLYTDFQNIKRQMDEIQARIKSIENTATNSINIEESRRAVAENIRSVQQNKNLARLTFLATIFIPLNFTSSFLSISPDFSSADQTIWLFFVIGIPLTILAMLVVDLSGNKSFVRTKFHNMRAKKEKPAEEVEEDEKQRPPPQRMTTIPWSGMRQRLGTTRVGNH